MMTDNDKQQKELTVLRQRVERLEKAQDYASKVVLENNHLRDELYLTYTSWSWRLTAPLRKLSELVRKIKG